MTSVGNKQGRYKRENKDQTYKQCSFGTNCALVFITNTFCKNCVHRHCETNQTRITNISVANGISDAFDAGNFHSKLDFVTRFSKSMSLHTNTKQDG
jgi:hypothetical protein